MIVGCLADRKPVDLHLFRNYEGPQDILGEPITKSTGPDFEPLTPYDKQLLWEAARASGAAPSYFRWVWLPVILLIVKTTQDLLKNFISANLLK